jgi:hypothetical protein
MLVSRSTRPSCTQFLALRFPSFFRSFSYPPSLFFIPLHELSLVHLTLSHLLPSAPPLPPPLSQELSRTMDTAPMAAQAVQSWHDCSNGRRTIAFCVNNTHAKRIAAAFNNAGALRHEHSTEPSIHTPPNPQFTRHPTLNSHSTHSLLLLPPVLLSPPTSLYTSLPNAGVPAEHVHASTSRDQRAAMYARLRSKETLVVTSVDVLSEGAVSVTTMVCL